MGAAAAERGGGAVRLLRENPAFRALFGARVISYSGDSLSLVALMLYVADTTGQALAVSLLLLVGDFLPSLLSPITGAISDRFGRGRIMITCELVQGAIITLIAMALPMPLPVLLALVAVRAIAGQVFLPASRAAVPALVRERDLEAANSVLGFGTNGAEAAGPLLAAALFPLVGVRGVLLADAATFLVAAVLLTAVRLTTQPAPQHRSSLLGDAKLGLGYIWAAPAVRVIALGFFAIVAFNGIDDVALVLLAKDDLGAGDSAVGLLLAAVGIGLLFGYLLLARYGMRTSMVVLLPLGFAVSSVGNLLTGLAWAVAAAFALQTVRGLGIAAMDLAANTLLQRLVPAGMLGRVFGNLYGAIGVAAGLSYLSGGLLLDATSASTTFLLAGTGGTLAAITVARALPRALRNNAPADS
jgi:MFS family permease